MRVRRILLLVLCMLTLVACGDKKASADDERKQEYTLIDSISYMAGWAQTIGLRLYISTQMEVDTARHMRVFVDGILESAGLGSEKSKEIPDDEAKRKAYIAGLQIGQQLNQAIAPLDEQIYGNDSTKMINRRLFYYGFCDGVLGKRRLGVSLQFVQNNLAELIERERSRSLLSQYGDYKLECEDFIERMAQEEGVQHLPGGTLYRILTHGYGRKPNANSTVMVKYEGKTIDGEVFDSTEKNNNGMPTEIRIELVIQGWKEALQQMSVGSKWVLYIPQDQAYGSRGIGDMIKPFSALIFTIELVDIK